MNVERLDAGCSVNGRVKNKKSVNGFSNPLSLWIVFIIFLSVTFCNRASETDLYGVPDHISDEVLNKVPVWATEAVWYQIFVERFRDGDPNNQPTLSGIEGSWPHEKPDNWQPTRWTQDWYAMEDWAQQSGRPFYMTVQMRRYGGDLQGVLDKLDYLQDLGITAIYFNPLNDSPSLHKFDARNYHHIDIFFGPDPQGDLEIMASEDPADPSTWKWTSADLLFLKVVEEAKKRGIRVVMDYSWNHTGITFWAWKDVLKHQQNSPYADWYRIDSFRDEEAGTDFQYTGWAGVSELPEFKRHGPGADEPFVHGQPPKGDLHPEIKRHIFAVTRRWLDPTGTGDLSKGIDGFRLDVAELIPSGFWHDYRKFVRSINPDAYLVGELWWENWPVRMIDPGPWLNGDIFDANMNYRWYMPSRSYFGKAEPRIDKPTAYIAHLDSVSAGFRQDVLKAHMNLTASHDSPRFMTSMFNRNRYKHNVNPRENQAYKLHRADAATLERMHLLLVQQFTTVGSPHIWMGDEMGMWGADDPDNRKPLIWQDLTFDDETKHPLGLPKQSDRVAFDNRRFDLYRELIRMRREHPVFIHGSMEFTLADDTRNLLGYERILDSAKAIIIFNNDDRRHVLKYDTENDTNTNRIYSTHNILSEREHNTLYITLPPRSAIVFLNSY